MLKCRSVLIAFRKTFAYRLAFLLFSRSCSRSTFSFFIILRSRHFRFFTQQGTTPTTRLQLAAMRCLRRLFATVTTAHRYAELLARIYTSRFNFHRGVSSTTCERDVADGLLVFTACLNRSPATPRQRREHPEARLRAFRLQNITMHTRISAEKNLREYMYNCSTIIFDSVKRRVTLCASTTQRIKAKTRR